LSFHTLAWTRSVQLRHLAERNEKRGANLRYLSEGLESLGCFDIFLPPHHIQRTYFEYIVHYDAAVVRLSIDRLVSALQAEGCQVTAPRYPLVHEQPFFSEGHWKRILRSTLHSTDHCYAPDTLTRTRAFSRNLLLLPTFPNGNRTILDQHLQAFLKVLASADEIASQRDRAET
jgi:dTDP-4-amino-4,6-dideoxygalactose transaminase